MAAASPAVVGMNVTVVSSGGMAVTLVNPQPALNFTGPLGLADGTVALPSLTFASDLDTGLYRIGANNIGVAVNGAKVLDIATTGLTVTGALTTSGVFTSNGAGVGRVFQTTGANDLILGWNTNSVERWQQYVVHSDGSMRWYGTSADRMSLTQTGGLTLANGLTITAGGATITAGNLVVTAGNVTAQGASSVLLLGAASSTVGFYGHAAVALQTGVAVTAGGIHAALVALGLITA